MTECDCFCWCKDCHEVTNMTISGSGKKKYCNKCGKYHNMESECNGRNPEQFTG